ncbi:glycosyltransferase [Parerythrobacter aurantius]|uniref:glycosyltransferase n=1 Tax=Parerythrobacter aurantius TaxID=3127706 RepID=UPI003250AF07
MRIIYLGFNDPRIHVRGTENVIKAQSEASASPSYYIFRSRSVEVFRWGNLVAIGVPFGFFAAAILLRQLAARIGRKHRCPIVFHGHSYLLSAIASGAPLVFTIHDGLTYLKRSGGARFLLPFRIIERWVYRRARLIHTISDYAWSEAEGGRHHRHKLHLIYNTLAAEPADVLPVATATDLPEAAQFLVVRGIEERANFELVFLFAEYCRDHLPFAVTRVAGKGPLLDLYRAQCETRKLNNLLFLGYVDDATLHDLYVTADCVIMPALYGEGFGLPLIEAYARGVAAVGSNVCAVPEIIYSPSLLFENDVSSLISAIRAARTTPPVSFAGYYKERFSKEKIISDYRQLYGLLQSSER